MACDISDNQSGIGYKGLNNVSSTLTSAIVSEPNSAHNSMAQENRITSELYGSMVLKSSGLPIESDQIDAYKEID